MKVISHQTLLAKKLTIPNSYLDELAAQSGKGVLGGGLLAAIVFIVTSLSSYTYGIIFTTTVVVFAPVWIPALVTLIVGGTSIAAIIAFLKQFGFLNNNKREIKESFNSSLDQLAEFIYGLVFVPAIGVLLLDRKKIKEKKAIVKETLEEWGYNSEWVNSKVKEIFKGNSTAIAVTSKLLWKEYRSRIGKKQIDTKYGSMIEDLPNPEFLKKEMLKMVQEFVFESCSEKQSDYIKNLDSF